MAPEVAPRGRHAALCLVPERMTLGSEAVARYGTGLVVFVEGATWASLFSGGLSRPAGMWLVEPSQRRGRHGAAGGG